MRTKFIIIGLMLALPGLHAFAQSASGGALTGKHAFTTPGAVAAQSNYNAGLNAARVKYAADLDQAVKVALTAANLEEANAINATRQKLATEGPPVATDPFKTSQANEARLRYQAAVANVQRQYGRDLQQALKGAMAAANLEESNEINTEIKALVTLLALPGSSNTALPPLGQSGPKALGLQILRYARLPSQTIGDNYNGYVSLEDMGKPLDVPQTVSSLSTWTKDKNENAVVSGFIKIEKAGTYEFRTNSDFDRNELVINGKIVCKFRDGANKEQSARLKAGFIPVTSIAYANRTSETRIQWKPPGQEEWSDIPDELISH